MEISRRFIGLICGSTVLLAVLVIRSEANHPVANVSANGTSIPCGVLPVLNGTTRLFQCLGAPHLIAHWTVYHANTMTTMNTSKEALREQLTHKDDGNIYTCVVSNSTEELQDQCSVTIQVYNVPEAVDSNSIQVTSKMIRSATVQWAQPEDNHYSILYYHLRLAICDGSSHDKCLLLNTFRTIDNVTTLDNLSPFSLYSLQIAAENSVGIGPYSKPVMVQADREMVTLISGIGSTLVLVGVALVVMLVVVGCIYKWRKKRRRIQRNYNIRDPELDLDYKDHDHYTALNMGKVEPRGPYASLRYTSTEVEWNEDTYSFDSDSSYREYMVPPDAIPKPVGVSGGFVDSDTAKPVATTLDSVSNAASPSTATASSMTNSAGKNILLPPKVALGDKKPSPTAFLTSTFPPKSNVFNGKDAAARSAATALRDSGKSANCRTAMAVSEVSSKISSTRKEKTAPPKVPPDGKKPATHSVHKLTPKRKAPAVPIQITNRTTTSRGASSVPTPATTNVLSAATKQTGKGKQSFSLPAASQHQAAAMNVVGGGTDPAGKKTSVAQLAKRFEKGAP